MRIESIGNGKTFIEFREKMKVGERERFEQRKEPLVSTNRNGEMTVKSPSFEDGGKIYAFARLVDKIVVDGEDKTPKDRTISSMLAIFDDVLEDGELIDEVYQAILTANKLEVGN